MNNSNNIKLAKNELLELFKSWLKSWGKYDLNSIMALFHEDIVFKNWDGTVVKGKSLLEKTWRLWFSKGKDFRFIKEDIFVDEEEQKLLFSWRLEWLSNEVEYKGENEIRRGVDIVHFIDGKIIKKESYSKTKVKIGSRNIILKASSK